jgi:PAS domain S-box-containing protein
MTAQQIQRLVHELQVHQIELELQNEELRNAQVELAHSRDRYSDLYEFAPVGYLTVDVQGRILESNLTAAEMLGVDRRTLRRASFSRFIPRESQDDWCRFQRSALSSEAKQTCELWMRKADGEPLAADLQSTAFGAENERRLLVAFIDITARKEAEDALRRLSRDLEKRVEQQTSQIQLQAEAIENLSDGVLITRGAYWPDSEIVFVNQAMCRITGYAADELMGKARSILAGPKTDRQTLRDLGEKLLAGQSSRAELVSYRKDGTLYDAEVSISPIRIGENRQISFVAVHRDVTEQRRIEHALRQSEQRFRMLADHAPVMIWMSGPDQRTSFVNKLYLDFTGRTLEQEADGAWVDAIHPEDRERSLEIYRRAFDARAAFAMEFRFRRSNGEWRWVLGTGSPWYRDDSGTFSGYIGTCIDVTDRRQAEDGIREREQRLRAILTAAADAIITIDRHGALVSVNPAAERIFGYRQEEILGRNVTVLMANDSDFRLYLPRGDRSAETRHEVMARRKDGTPFPVEVTVSEVEHRHLFMGIIRDISVRKQTEEALDHYRRDLQTMSAELMLAEERERQQLAQDLHDGLGQAIFLARRKLDQKSIAEVGSILDEVAGMVDNLTSELSPRVLQQLGFRSAIRWLARDMHRRYGLSIRMSIEPGPPFPFEEGVSVVLYRSVRELLINVARHAKTDFATLKVRKHRSNVVIVVEDRGKGFDVEGQVRPSMARRFGLFSIRERLEYLGGTFEIKSTPGKGTKITLTAPLLSAKAAAKGE